MKKRLLSVCAAVMLVLTGSMPYAWAGVFLAPPGAGSIILDDLSPIEFNVSEDTIKLLRRNLLFAQILQKTIQEAQNDALIYKKLVFDLAALLVGKCYPVIEIFMEVHHYKHYKQAMAVMGVAVIIASHFDPAIREQFNRPLGDFANWNDIERNSNRLAGFFRDEKQAMPFVQTLKAELKHKPEPWYIDNQIAILDVLEAVDYTQAGILSKVKTNLQKLAGTKGISPIVSERIEEVIRTLEAGGRKPLYQGYENELMKEFRLYMRTLKQTDISYLKILEDLRSKIPVDEYGSFDRDLLEAYFADIIDYHDPIDHSYPESGYGKTEEPIRRALARVRIDYDESAALILGKPQCLEIDEEKAVKSVCVSQ